MCYSKNILSDLPQAYLPYYIMIVSFAEFRRTSSGASNSSMIVSFAERRRRGSNASNSSSHLSKNGSGRSDRRGSRSPGSQTSPGNEHPLLEIGSRNYASSATPKSERTGRQSDALSDHKSRSMRELIQAPKLLSRHTPEKGVIVEFPDRNPQNHGRRLRDVNPNKKLTVSGIFRKHEAARSVHTTSANARQMAHNSSTKKMREKHTRKFNDEVDWKNSSIDWGDEDDSATDEDEDKKFSPKSITRGKKSMMKRTEQLAHSSQTAQTMLSSSINSLLSFRSGIDNV